MPFVSERPALQLTEDELEYINRASKSRTLPESAVERAKILLGYYEHKSISQIARDLDTNRPKVERTIDKAFAYGIYPALEDLPRSGRPRKISSGARTWILSLACSKPLDHGYPYELWTQRLLAEHIRSHCLDKGFPELSKLSRGTVSKILGASNVKPHKISSYLAPIDPEFEPKSVVVLHTYKQVELLQQISKEDKPLDLQPGNLQPSASKTGPYFQTFINPSIHHKKARLWACGEPGNQINPRLYRAITTRRAVLKSSHYNNVNNIYNVL